MSNLTRFVTVLVAVGLGLFACVARPDQFDGFLSIAPVTVLLTLYGEWRAPYIPGFGALNFAEAVYFAVALEQGPAQAALLAAGVGIMGDYLRRKTPHVKLFNFGWALTTFVAVGAAARWAGYRDPRSVGAVLVAGAVYFVVAGGLQSVAQVLLEDMTLRDTIAFQFGLMRYSLASALCLGCACAALLRTTPWLSAVLAFPIEMLSGYLEKDRLHKELVSTQAALVQAEKQAALGLMAAGVAHELNTPLAAILVNSHMLADPFLPPDLQQHCVKLVERSATRARDIVAALRDVSKPVSSGAGQPQVALSDAVAALSCTVAGDFNGLPAVALPTGPLTQVLTNLLQNAVLACSGTPILEVGCQCSGQEVSLYVQDNGAGIPADIIGRIWDPFFTTRTVGSGTGLGLWLCKSMVEGVGGHIDVTRTGPDGTVVTITLPQAKL